jgi:hypothetical protein
LYDTDDEEDDLEAARRAGGWHYRRLAMKRTVRNAKGALWTGFMALVPRPQATSLPNDMPASALGIPKRNTEGKRFKAPKGKRRFLPYGI